MHKVMIKKIRQVGPKVRHKFYEYLSKALTPKGAQDMEREKLGLIKTVDLEEAANFLQELADSIKSGTVVVNQDDDFVTLELPSMVDIDIQAKNKDGKAKFHLDLSWKASSIEKQKRTLNISSKMPEEAASPKPAKAAPKNTGKAKKSAKKEDRKSVV